MTGSGNPIFSRKIYQKMLQWKHDKDGATALLIKGARRVGKSTIAEEFAKHEYDSYVIINFDNAKKEVWEAVENIADIDNFFLQIQFLYGVTLIQRKSVVIFDEIQKAPKARQAIKYLVKDHRYDYIETGSLLSIKKNVREITIPSEETRITMHPLDYEEFRWALGDSVTVPLLQKAFTEKRPLGDNVNRKIMRDFRLYMMVGGMPQAVEEYLTSQSLMKVDEIKREILELYSDDFRKIDSSGKISRLFLAIPSELSKNTNRYMPKTVLGRKPDSMDELLEDMEDSLCVNFAYHADNPSVGLALHKNKNMYKMFLNDTGLFITLSFMDKATTENAIYQQLLSDKLSADLGYVYENVVAQMLTASGNNLFYHSWPTPSGKHNYEVDFLLSRGNKLWPIEVKSSGYKTHISLDEFCRKYSSFVDKRFLIYTKDLRKDSQTTLLPVYMTPFL